MQLYCQVRPQSLQWPFARFVLTEEVAQPHVYGSFIAARDLDKPGHLLDNPQL